MSRPDESGGARILVVIDDAEFRETLAKTLMLGGGYEVAMAADSFEAGYLFARLRPHLVILDVVLRGMGGLDLCKRIRSMSRDADAQIIVLTGCAAPETGETSLLSGADLVLTKPQCFDSLVVHVQELLEA